jgi:hypothetical protein
MKKYKLSDGLSKKERLKKSKKRGRLHERQSAQVYREMGYIVEDLNDHTTGYDYRIKKRHPVSGEPIGDWIYVECKAGHHSKLSARQQEMKEKKGKNYRVKRNPFQ